MMQKLFRLLAAALLAFTLGLGLTSDAFAKKQRASAKKSIKAKRASGKKTARPAKKSSRKSASRRRNTSPNRRATVARQPAETRANPAVADADDSDPNAPPLPRAVAAGITADRVMEIQSALTKAGYYTGEAHGVYDEQTKQAMRQYQQANNLSASGLPSAHTLKKLGVAKRSNSTYATPIKKASDDGQP